MVSSRGPRTAAPPARFDARRDAARWAAIGVGLLALGLCLWRLMPGLGFWDTAEFQMVLPVLGTAHPTGYPTYVLLGWLFSTLLSPLGEAAFRMNVLSAILVAVGTALSVDLARRLSGSLLLGIAAGLGVVLTPIVWAIGTHADPHSLHFALTVLILWLLVRWEHARRGNPFRPADGRAPARHADQLLLAAAVVTGLAVGNHSLTLFLGPPILLYVLAVDRELLRRPRFIGACIAAFAIPTILVRFEMILRAGWFRAPFVYADPSTWDGFWYVTLGAQFHDWVTDPLANGPQRIADLTTIAVSQLGPLAPLVVVAFVVTAVRQPRYGLLSGLTMAMTCFFNSIYPDGAIDRYYIVPALLAWTWLAILGAAVVDALSGGAVVGPTILRAFGRRSAVLRSIGLGLAAVILLAPSLFALPARARLVDRTDDRAAERWTAEVLSALEPNAVVVSWWSYSTPLWYAQIVEGRRPDIYIVDDRTRLDLNLGELDQVIDRYLATRPVYLIRNGSSELGRLVGRYDVRPAGGPLASNLLRVMPIATARAGR